MDEKKVLTTEEFMERIRELTPEQLTEVERLIDKLLEKHK